MVERLVDDLVSRDRLLQYVYYSGKFWRCKEACGIFDVSGEIKTVGWGVGGKGDGRKERGEKGLR